MEKEFIIQVAGIMIGGLGTLFLGLLTWGLKNLISSVIKTNKELAVIKEQLKYLVEETRGIPKMQKDLNNLYAKIRTIEEAAE